MNETMDDLRASVITRAILVDLTDLLDQVRAPLAPLASVIRVLAEPLQFLGFINASQKDLPQLTGALPR